MKMPRPFVFIAVLLLLVLAACSQLEDTESTQLLPQLGHPHTTGSVSISVNQTGQIYTYSKSAWIEEVAGGELVLEDTNTTSFLRI